MLSPQPQRTRAPALEFQGSWWSLDPHDICFLNKKAERVLEIEGLVKRAVNSMSAILGSEVKITHVYDF